LDEIASLEKKLSQTLSLSSLTLKNTSFCDESTTTKAVTLFLSLSLFFFFFGFLYSSLRRQRSTKRVTKTFFSSLSLFFLNPNS